VAGCPPPDGQPIAFPPGASAWDTIPGTLAAAVVDPAPEPWSRKRRRPLRWRRARPSVRPRVQFLWLCLGALLILTLSSAVSWIQQLQTVTPPVVPPLDLTTVLADRRPVRVIVRARDGRHQQVSTVERLQSDVTLWRSMHLAEWNAVPASIRQAALDRMLTRYRSLFASPAVWDHMTAHDWDLVPQPIRTVVYRQMTAYWSGYYDVGGVYGLAPGLVADTLAAIVMSESWFDHRGRLVNQDGSVDVGLGGASAYARRRLPQLLERGVVDVAPADGEYDNPWVATRFVAVWMSLLLAEAQGDLDLAVRAYNRGIGNAMDSAGAAYLATVKQRRRVFIRNHDAPPAWAYIWERARELEARAWPWIRYRTPAGQVHAAPPPPIFTVTSAGDCHVPASIDLQMARPRTTARRLASLRARCF